MYIFLSINLFTISILVSKYSQCPFSVEIFLSPKSNFLKPRTSYSTFSNGHFLEDFKLPYAKRSKCIVFQPKVAQFLSVQTLSNSNLVHNSQKMFVKKSIVVNLRKKMIILSISLMKTNFGIFLFNEFM